MGVGVVPLPILEGLVGTGLDRLDDVGVFPPLPLCPPALPVLAGPPPTPPPMPNPAPTPPAPPTGVAEPLCTAPDEV